MTVVGVAHILDKLHENLGVGLALKSVSVLRQGFAQNVVVLDSAVVDDRY